MRRKQAGKLQNAGMLLITAVMLADQYLLPIREEIILTCAVISAAALGYAIYVLKKHEIEQCMGSD